jgi:hypothetical protein
MHRQAAITSFKGFSAIERLATEPGLSAADEWVVVVDQVMAEFKNFKSTLSESNTSRKRVPPAPVQPSTAHPAEPFEKFMDFLRGEFEGLENLLRSQLGDRKAPADARSTDSRRASDSPIRKRPEGRGPL